MVKGRLKTERILIVWAVITAIWGHISYLTNIHNLTTYSYTALILFWVFSLKKEIPDTYVRRLMSLGGYLLTLLFILRFIKYNLVTKYTFPHRLMWYGYYIPVLITLLLSFIISLSIGNKDRQKLQRIFLPLKLACAFLLILVLTNDLHGLAIKIWYVNDEEYSSMGLFYYLIILWYVILMLLSFVIMYRKSRLSSYRKYWKIPFAVEITGILLWLWYYIICKGSSPEFNGHSLYNIQEVYVLLFLGFWEALISIGLIPSVSLAKEKKWINEGILDSVKDAIAALKSTLDGIWLSNEDDFRLKMIHASCIGVYMKRRANLELISGETSILSTGEFSLSVREFLDYVSFSDISTGFEESGGEVEIPTLLLSAAFDMIKNILIKSENACYIKLLTGRTDRTVSFVLSVESDMVLETGTQSPESLYNITNTELINALNAGLNIKEEDGTWRVELSASYPLKRSLFFWDTITYENINHGLSGLTTYLSLDREALAVKTHIHDSLGSCLLMTKSYLLESNTVSRDTLIYFWLRVTEEMSEPDIQMESPDLEKAYDYCIKQAKAIGVDVIIKGKIPEDKRLMKVVDTALATHITNILRHASGSRGFYRHQ